MIDHIEELRAELRGCRFTRRERAKLAAELANAIAERAAVDRACDDAIGEMLAEPFKRA